MTHLALATALLASVSSATPAAKPTVAVLYFDYEGKSEEMGLLKKGLAQLLISDLSASSNLQILERARLQDLLDELKLNQSGSFDKATANKVGRLLGAHYLIMGSYFDVLGTLRLDARAVETETGRIIRSVGASGKPDDFLELEQKIAAQLGDALVEAAQSREKSEKPAVPGTMPERPKRLPAKVAIQYSKALDAIDRDDKEAARRDLEAVVREQPDFQLASAELNRLLQ
ncbi:MAG: CsgG/HfaB family protein [Myxococcales bacterium]|jgi:TolB-like protein